MRILKFLLIIPIILSLKANAERNMINPLITHKTLPDFNAIKPEHFEPAVDRFIKEYKDLLDRVVKEPSPTWNNTIQKLDEESLKLDFAIGTASHLNMVKGTEDVRKAWDALLPKISSFSSDLKENKELYLLYKKLEASPEYSSYCHAQKMVIKNAIRNFKLSGIDLKKSQKDRLRAISDRLSELSNKFSKNVMDSTQEWVYQISEDKQYLLDGLSSHTIALAKAKAQKDGKGGWALTLDEPCYIAIMSYAQNRDLRQMAYRGYETIASDQATNKKFDNSKVINEIIALRQEYANIIGYKNYADFSLVPKMAETTDEVMNFLHDLAKKAKPQGEKEIAALKTFAKEQDKIEDFAPWDLSYYATLYQKLHYNFSDEDLRPYFPESKVFKGLAQLASRLYGIKLKEVKTFSKWDPAVKLYEVLDFKGNLRGRFYTDLYARDFKQSGAWAMDLNTRMKHADGSIEYPLDFLVANFTPASGSKPALLSHKEIVTLFHEFGHILHGILTKVNYPGVSGRSVARDAVELPSQFMENWAFDWDVVKSISSHYQTGQELPKSEFDKLIATKNYNSAMFVLRQLTFSMFDFRLHMNSGTDKGKSPEQILQSVRKEVGLLAVPSYTRFPNRFLHIFAGGYSASYYGYHWAEVLSSDIFGKFEEEGGCNSETGKLFMETILEQGGSREPMDLFLEFRGRTPKLDAFLKANGIESTIAKSL